MFSKTQYVDICNYHNQTYDFLEAVFKQTNYCPKKLINFDLHSDVHCNRNLESVKVASWVNFVLDKFNIDEYYWVIPKAVISDENMYNHIFRKINRITTRWFIYGII